MAESTTDRPLTWSIDTLIHQLFYRDDAPWTQKLRSRIRDTSPIEQAIRDNDVDGDVFLAIGEADLKNDLKITSLGQRRVLLEVSFYLRGSPPGAARQLSIEEKMRRFQDGMATPEITQSRIAGSPIYSQADIRPSIERDTERFTSTPLPREASMHAPTYSHERQLTTPNAYPMTAPQSTPIMPFGFTNPSPIAHASVTGPETHLPPTSYDSVVLQPAPQKPRARLHSEIVEPDIKPFKTPVDEDQMEDDTRAVPAMQQTQQTPSPLDVLENHVEQSLQNHTAAEHLEVSGAIGQVGAAQPDKKKRRVAPEPVLDLQHKMLGSQAMPLQDTFYGSDGDSEVEFTILPEDQNQGLSQVVLGRMHHYLKTPARAVPETSLMARVPYLPQQCTGPYSKSYFTVFGPRSLPMVRKLQDWPQVLSLLKGDQVSRPKRVQKIEAERQSNTSIVDPDGQKAFQPPRQESDSSELDEWAYLLARYPVETDESNALPVYAGSNEDEFDDETWREIQADQAEDQAAPAFLSESEIIKAIDEAVSELEKQWQEYKLPKAQARYYRLWKQCARAKQRQPEISRAYAEQNRLNARVDGIRAALLKETWRNAADVKKQSQSLEQTVFDKMELQLRLEVLHSDEEPLKPKKSSLKTRSRSKPILEEGEEVLESDSEPDDGFIIEDTTGHDDTPLDPLDEEWQPELRPRKRSTPRGGSPAADITASSPDPLNETPVTTRRADHIIDSSADEADIESDAEESIVSPADRRRAGDKRKQPRTLKSKQHGSVVADFDDSLVDADAQDSDQGSDLDAPPRLPPSRFKRQGTNQSEAIDLTYSDPMEIDDAAGNGSDFSVQTPELNPPDTPEDCQQETKAIVPVKARVARSQAQKEMTELPSLEDVPGIRNLSWHVLQDVGDPDMALRKAIYSLSTSIFADLADFAHPVASNVNLAAQKEILKEGLLALSTDSGFVNTIKDKYQAAAKLLTLLFMTSVLVKDLVKSAAPSEMENRECFEMVDDETHPFFESVLEAVEIYDDYLMNAPPDKAGGKKRKTMADNDASSDMEILSNTEDGPSSHTKRRKREVAESQEAIDQQETDHLRIMLQEQRRKLMQDKLKAFGTNTDAVCPVNTMEPIIYLDPHIAQRVKPHQVKGIQFLWRELIEDPKHQGCLLAHTMGLGKTMQVISLLITIAQCNKSDDEQVRQLVPQHLRLGRTLILCPASLLENWFDELLMWLPPTDLDLLGNIYKISSADQLGEIEAWAQGGGILIVNYIRFQRLHSPTLAQREARGEKQEELESWLLKDAGLVIADEAHQMKNPKAKISVLASKFTTKSRVALTGSPLNNHLEEYHQMINWLAPGYLGDLAQFKSKYVEPIVAGLYADSTPWERRLSLRKLHVLKRDVEPKVDRADISAIRKDLPPKTEYFITLPPTELQRAAYDIYVKHMLAKQDNAELENRRKNLLFEIIATLSLLLNHPQSFVDKLDVMLKKIAKPIDSEKKRAKTAMSIESDEADITTDAESPTSASTPGHGYLDDPELLVQDIDGLQSAKNVFNELIMFGSLAEAEVSHRTYIVKQILTKALAAGEKTLLFSHSIPALNYLETMLNKMNVKYYRIDGGTVVGQRQGVTKQFNDEANEVKIFLISIRAGGLGLNLQGATRVIIFDFGFNPMWEQQAVGRAYRLGQRKPVFIYRFRCGGTYEDVVNNKSVFKDQLFQRVVDKKKPERYATKALSDYFLPAKEIQQQDLSEFMGADPSILDQILAEDDTKDLIRNIELTETFQKEDDEDLEEHELKEAEAEYADEQLKRNNPEEWRKKRQLPRPVLAQPSLANKLSAFATIHPSLTVNHSSPAGRAPAEPKIGKKKTPKEWKDGRPFPGGMLKENPNTPSTPSPFVPSDETLALSKEFGQAVIDINSSTSEAGTPHGTSGDDKAAAGGCKAQ